MMSIENILQQINKEIADLTKVRAALTGLGSVKPTVKGKKRVISAMARKRMAKAQKARWAKFRAVKKR
jgi:hypothetical protein